MTQQQIDIGTVDALVTTSISDTISNRPPRDCGRYPILQSFGQLVWRGPQNVIVLTSVEVHVVNICVTTGPDNRNAEAHSKSRFKIDSLAISGEVGYDKSTAAYFRDDYVINFLIVLYSIYSDRNVKGCLESRFNAVFVCILQILNKPHCNESLIRRRISSMKVTCCLPALGGKPIEGIGSTHGKGATHFQKAPFVQELQNIDDFFRAGSKDFFVFFFKKYLYILLKGFLFTTDVDQHPVHFFNGIQDGFGLLHKEPACVRY